MPRQSQKKAGGTRKPSIKKREEHRRGNLTWVDRVRVPPMEYELAPRSHGRASVEDVWVAARTPPPRPKVVEDQHVAARGLGVDVELREGGLAASVLGHVERYQHCRHADIVRRVQVVPIVAVQVVLTPRTRRVSPAAQLVDRKTTKRRRKRARRARNNVDGEGSILWVPLVGEQSKGKERAKGAGLKEVVRDLIRDTVRVLKQLPGRPRGIAEAGNLLHALPKRVKERVLPRVDRRGFRERGGGRR